MKWYIKNIYKPSTKFLFVVGDNKISDIFYQIQKFLRTSWAPIITTNGISFLMAKPFQISWALWNILYLREEVRGRRSGAGGLGQEVGGRRQGVYLGRDRHDSPVQRQHTAKMRSSSSPALIDISVREGGEQSSLNENLWMKTVGKRDKTGEGK